LLASFAGVRIRRQRLRGAISLTRASPHEMAANRRAPRQSMFDRK
jgi:hypothetical protein